MRDDVGLDGDARVIRLAGEVGRAVVVLVLFDSVKLGNVGVGVQYLTIWGTGRRKNLAWAIPRLLQPEPLFIIPSINRCLTDGSVLVAGGLGKGGMILPAEIYDPAIGKWTPAGSLAEGRSSHTATLLGDGKVLVAGGLDNKTDPASPMAGCELFDPVTRKWSPTGSMIEARHTHSATLLATGKVLVAGDNGNLLESSELYDPKTGRWSLTGKLSGVRGADHACLSLPGGKVAVLGGWDGMDAVKEIETYDPNTGKWELAGKMKIPRAQFTATLLTDGRIIVVGGRDGEGRRWQA